MIISLQLQQVIENQYIFEDKYFPASVFTALNQTPFAIL